MVADTSTSELLTFDSRDGTAIGLWRTGSGPCLLAVHGTAADHTAWDPVLPFLAGSFAVYAMDRRGRGASGDSDPYAIEREFEDVVAAVAALPGPVHIYGHSFGATCAAEAALQTSNLGRVILYEGGPRAPGLLVYADELISKLERLVEDGLTDEALSTFMLTTAGVTEAELRVLRGRPSWAARVRAAPTIPRELRAISAYGTDLARFATLNARALLLVGSETDGRRREVIVRLLDALPNAELEVLPGQKHAAHQTAPQLFARVITEFLTR